MAFPQYNQVNNTMKFSQLDATDGSFPIYVIGWRIRDNPDVWTDRFLSYKYEKSRVAFNAGSWIFKKAVLDIMHDLEFDPEHTVLINALGSADTGPNKSAILYRTTKWIAEQVGADFATNLFAKEAHQPLKNQAGAEERDAQVANKYTCADLPENVSNVIILDDLVTRGATFSEIKRAVSARSPDLNFAGVALGKNENQKFADYFGITLSNDHVTGPLIKLWEEAEQRF